MTHPRDKNNFFTAEDFEFHFVGDEASNKYVLKFFPEHKDMPSLARDLFSSIANQANAILSKYIEEEGRVVFGKKGESDDVKRLWWCDFKAIDDTHKAILLFIEELKHDKSEGEG